MREVFELKLSHAEGWAMIRALENAHENERTPAEDNGPIKWAYERLFRLLTTPKEDSLGDVVEPAISDRWPVQ